jgi:Phage tail assembly chaperone protein, TAC
MTDSFGAAALALYSFAARLLGWKPADFWNATPAELVAALVQPGAPTSLDRSDIARMMEQENE